jgi:hypothetical protein
MQRSSFFRLLTFACLATSSVEAQTIDYRPNFIPPSPDASALGKYGENPIGLWSGTTPVSVPVYTVVDGNLELPININYHGAGNKVDEAASFMGLGFTLNAGGAIMRSVRNLPDDYPVKGFLDYNATYPTHYLNSNPSRYTQWQEIAAGCGDAEPDAYYFNFNGYTGSFSLRDYSDGVYILSKNAWRAEMLKTDVSNPKKITGWKFTCDNGVAYTFAAAEQATITDNGIACQTGIVYNSAWYLTNITSPNGGRSINFTYETYSMNFNVHQGEVQRIFCYANPGGCNSTLPTSTPIYTKMVYAGQRIKTITTSDNGTTVTFNYLTTRTDEPGTNLKQLDEIVINNKDNALFRKFNFTFDYSTGRLTLKSVKKTGTNEPPYLFDYSSYTLPPRIANGGTAASYGQDHWGYSNLKSSNNSLLPPVWKKDPSSTTAPLIYYPGADRRTLAMNSTGMLTKLTYPSGGFDEYIYETNQYGLIGSQTLGNLGFFETTKVGKSVKADALAQSPVLEDAVISDQHITITGTTDNSMVDVTLELKGSQVPNGTATVLICKDDGGDPGTSTFFKKTFTFQTTEQLTRAYIKLPGGGNYLVRAIAAGVKVPSHQNPDGSWPPTYYSHASITVKWTAEQPTTVPLKSRLGGGSRISSIKSSAFMNDPNAMTRQFRYESDQTGYSSGVLNEEPKYDVQNLKYYTSGEVACSYDLRIAQNQSVLGYGPSVIYGQVAELSGIDAANGKTVYKYQTHNDSPINALGQPPFQLLNMNYNYTEGGLTNFDLYKKIDPGYQLISENITTLSHYSRWAYDVLKVSFDGGNVTPAKFHPAFYKISHGVWEPLSTFKREYSTSGTSYTETGIERQFDNHGYLTLEKKIYDNNVSNADQTEYYYPDYFQNPTPAIQNLLDKNIIAFPLEVVNIKLKNYVPFYTGATLSLSALDANSKIYPSTTQKLQLTQPSTTYTYAAYSPAGVVDSRFVTINTLEKFDAKENLVQYTAKNGVTNSYFWDKHNTQPVVKAVGVAVDKMAWSGFENTTPNVFGGVWSLPGSYVTTDFATGKRAYTGTLTINTSTFLSQSYVLSFWMKGSSNFTVNGAAVTGTSNWTLYETKVTGGSGTSITIVTPAGGLVDEVRVYPVGAQMTTYGFDQLLCTNTECDEKNKPTFYESDNLGRLYLIRNQNKDIVKRVNYEYDILNPVNYTLTATQSGDYAFQFQVAGGSAGYTYEWDFGDLIDPVTTTSSSTTHAFPFLTLKYPVIVRVKSSTNVLATLTTEVLVTKQGGSTAVCNEGNFNISQLAQPNTFNFQAANIVGASYYWDLGNGTIQFGSNCQQVYTPGDYKVELTISVAGKSCSTSKYITAK